MQAVLGRFEEKGQTKEKEDDLFLEVKAIVNTAIVNSRVSRIP